MALKSSHLFLLLLLSVFRTWKRKRKSNVLRLDCWTAGLLDWKCVEARRKTAQPNHTIYQPCLLVLLYFFLLVLLLS